MARGVGTDLMERWQKGVVSISREETLKNLAVGGGGALPPLPPHQVTRPHTGDLLAATPVWKIEACNVSYSSCKRINSTAKVPPKVHFFLFW